MDRFLSKEPTIEVGCDEAGRGPLAGPVVAAAVILPRDFKLDGLNDSKKIKETLRLKLEIEIKNQAINWAVASCSPEEIDEFNILNASILAMHRAIDQLIVKPELILVDGSRFKNYPFIPHQCIVKGDGKVASIAAASILAKSERDRIMRQLAKQFPGYGWERNMAYPTLEHRLALETLGQTEVHRKSFVVKSIFQPVG
jgi:ribonuclease HII